MTLVGSKGTALNAGPVVRASFPVNVFGAVSSAVTEYHSGVRLMSYVNQVAKMIVSWWVKLMPQPDSESAGKAHHRSWKLVALVRSGSTQTKNIVPQIF